MNAARSLVLTGVRRHAIDRAPNEIAETPLRVHQRSRFALPRITDIGWLKRGPERNAPKGRKHHQGSLRHREPNGAEVTERTRV